MYKKATSTDETYTPSYPIIYRLGFSGGVGYNVKRLYVNLTSGRNIYGTNLDFGNKGALGVTNAKLVIGYKLGG